MANKVISVFCTNNVLTNKKFMCGVCIFLKFMMMNKIAGHCKRLSLTRNKKVTGLTPVCRPKILGLNVAVKEVIELKNVCTIKVGKLFIMAQKILLTPGYRFIFQLRFKCGNSFVGVAMQQLIFEVG